LGSSPNQPPRVINDDSFSPIISYNGSLQTSFVNLTNGGLILQGDLNVKVLIIGNSTLTITGSLTIDEVLTISSAYPPPAIKISQCLSGNGIIVFTTPPIDPIILQYNCETPPTLQIEYHFNTSAENGCKTLNHEYSKTALVIAWVNTCSGTSLENSEKTFPWDSILVPIICAVIGLALVVMVIYFVVRRINYNKNMEQFEI